MLKSQKLSDVVIDADPTILTDIAILDKWFSADGGMVRGSSIFITGTSGAGKTTFLMFLSKLLKSERIFFYERESLMKNVKKQIDHLNISNDSLEVHDKTSINNFDEFIEQINEHKPTLLMVDSLQAIADEDFAHMSGMEARMYVLNTLRTWAEKHNAILLLVGHNTKDGDFAGENKIMQYCDAHIEMVYDKKSNSRTMSWGNKNRKGPMGTLYYEIVTGEMKFYKEEEWLEKVIRDNSNSSLTEGLKGFLRRYFASIKGSKHPNYKEFVKEYNQQEKPIRNLYGEESFDYINQMIMVTENLKRRFKI